VCARARARACAQGSTPFLHACSILYKLRLAHTRAYKACGAALLLLFLATRVLAAPLCVASLWRHRALWHAAGQAPLLRAQLGVCAAFVALNYIWFAKLCRRALGLGGRAAAAARKKEDASAAAKRAADDGGGDGGVPLVGPAGEEKWE
jgi:hypothetical protein